MTCTLSIEDDFCALALDEPCDEVAPNLGCLPDDVLLQLMHRPDGHTLVSLGRTCTLTHAAASALPPLMFASRGKLVVFRGGGPASRANRICT